MRLCVCVWGGGGHQKTKNIHPHARVHACVCVHEILYRTLHTTGCVLPAYLEVDDVAVLDNVLLALLAVLAWQAVRQAQGGGRGSVFVCVCVCVGGGGAGYVHGNVRHACTCQCFSHRP